MWHCMLPTGLDLHQVEVSQEDGNLIKYEFSVCKHSEEKQAYLFLPFDSYFYSIVHLSRERLPFLPHWISIASSI